MFDTNSAACSWSRTTFFIVLFPVFLLFFFSSPRPAYRPLCTFFLPPVLSAYWWEILAGAREISEMKGAVKNAINCKLIFEIKADRGRPPRRPCSRRLRSWIRTKCVRWRVKHWGTGAPFALRLISLSFSSSSVLYCEINSSKLCIIYSFSDKENLAVSK